VRTAAKIAGVVLGAAVLLMAVFFLYPHPLLMLFDSGPPPIMDGIDPDRQPGALALVVRRFPAAATEKGLIAELRREGFKFDRPYLPQVIAEMNRKGENSLAASYAWDVDPCEYVLYVYWQADRAGRNRDIYFDKELGCRQRQGLEPAF